MGKYIPVEPEKWGEMVKAMAEVTRLKAEVERLRKAGDAMAETFFDCLVSQRLFPSDSPSLKRWIEAKKGNPNE